MRAIKPGLNFASQATMIAVNPRPPAVEVEIVWLEPETAMNSFAALMDDEARIRAMARSKNPYGDGYASERIASALEGRLVST